jgi:tetratricopeptide (TPR) repeat protein
MKPWQIGQEIDRLGELTAKAGELFKAGRADVGNAACDEICRGYGELLAQLGSMKLDRKDREEFERNALYGTACARSVQGQKAAALDALARALAAGFDNIAHINEDSDLDGIRGEPRFAELLASVGQAEGERESGEQAIQALQDRGDETLAAAGTLFRQGEGSRDAACARADEAAAIYARLVAELGPLKLPAAAKAEYRQHAYYGTACARTAQGRKDDAIDALDRTLAAGFDIWIQVIRDPDFDAIREEPRFKEVLSLAKATRDVYDFYREELRKHRALFDYDLRVTTVDGRALSLADLAGKVVIVTVFSTSQSLWASQAKVLSGLKQAFDGRLEIVGLAWESTEREVRAEGGAVAYPVALVTDRAALDKIPDFGGLGTTLFVDKAGRVRFRSGGRLDRPTLWVVARLLDMEDV